MTSISIKKLRADELGDYLTPLARILHECVKGGAAISFTQPFSMVDSRSFWEDKVFPPVRSEEKILLVAELNSVVAGTVQLDVSLPPNQPHRCEVAKLAVLPQCRGLGVATQLMHALEKIARQAKKTLITLDTRTGDKAEPLYRSLGFSEAGIIPDFALNPDLSGTHATTYMYKNISVLS